jgi:tetratricopeptide (TPR) repeat protein
MRIFAIPLFIFGLFIFGFSGESSGKSYKDLSPEKRKAFAADWLETGKAYYKSAKMNNAKSSFKNVIEIYPMGQSAEEARKLLKAYFKLDISYNPEKSFSDYVKSAENTADKSLRLSNYLMALEIKKDPAIIKKAAQLYLEMGKKEKSDELLNSGPGSITNTSTNTNQ